jgi:hypothetical protein
VTRSSTTAECVRYLRREHDRSTEGCRRRSKTEHFPPVEN